MRLVAVALVLATVVSVTIPSGTGSAAARPLDSNVAPAPCGGEAWPVVYVYQGSYYPTNLRLAAPHVMGGKVSWRWNSGTGSPVTASVTYNGKLALFDSGTKTSSTIAAHFAFTFFGAGTYRYSSKADATQKGSISVPMCNVPATARRNRSVWVQTSIKPLSAMAEDVEVKLPGATGWKWLKYRFKGVEFSWMPTLSGTYRLRARFRRLSNNTSSLFSPISTIKVG